MGWDLGMLSRETVAGDNAVFSLNCPSCLLHLLQCNWVGPQAPASFEQPGSQSSCLISTYEAVWRLHLPSATSQLGFSSAHQKDYFHVLYVGAIADVYRPDLFPLITWMRSDGDYTKHTHRHTHMLLFAPSYLILSHISLLSFTSVVLFTNWRQNAPPAKRLFNCKTGCVVVFWTWACSISEVCLAKNTGHWCHLSRFLWQTLLQPFWTQETCVVEDLSPTVTSHYSLNIAWAPQQHSKFFHTLCFHLPVLPPHIPLPPIIDPRPWPHWITGHVLSHIQGSEWTLLFD